MIDIMTQMQKYPGSNYPSHRRLLSGEDQLTCKRQLDALHHRMDGTRYKNVLTYI